MKNTTKTTTLLAISVALSCGTMKAESEAFQFKKGRLKIKLTEADTLKYTKNLADLSEANIPESFNGELVCEGKVLKKLPKDRYGQKVWEFQPDHILTGASLLPKSELRLTSPTLKNGGIDLIVGERYRIRADDLGKTFSIGSCFYVWKSGAIKI